MVEAAYGLVALIYIFILLLKLFVIGMIIVFTYNLITSLYDAFDSFMKSNYNWFGVHLTFVTVFAILIIIFFGVL